MLDRSPASPSPLHMSDQLRDNAVELSDGDPNVAAVDDGDVRTFTVVLSGTAKGAPLLVDSFGYKFCVKRSRGNMTDWRCSVRTKANTCPAVVIQNDNEFDPRGSHTHPPVFGLDVAAHVKLNIKHQAVGNIFQPATNVVDQCLQNLNPNQPMHAIPGVHNLARAVNYCRRRHRPADPQSLDFELECVG